MRRYMNDHQMVAKWVALMANADMGKVQTLQTLVSFTNYCYFMSFNLFVCNNLQTWMKRRKTR